MDVEEGARGLGTYRPVAKKACESCLDTVVLTLSQQPEDSSRTDAQVALNSDLNNKPSIE